MIKLYRETGNTV